MKKTIILNGNIIILTSGTKNKLYTILNRFNWASREFSNNNKTGKLYFVTCIDHFSKYAETYLITNKEQETVLKKIKGFIKNNGKPDKILTGKWVEFINKKFNKFWVKNDIVLLHGRTRHPQTQGAIERYNRTIKEYLTNMYI